MATILGHDLKKLVSKCLSRDIICSKSVLSQNSQEAWVVLDSLQSWEDLPLPSLPWIVILFCHLGPGVTFFQSRVSQVISGMLSLSTPSNLFITTILCNQTRTLYMFISYLYQHIYWVKTIKDILNNRHLQDECILCLDIFMRNTKEFTSRIQVVFNLSWIQKIFVKILFSFPWKI